MNKKQVLSIHLFIFSHVAGSIFILYSVDGVVKKEPQQMNFVTIEFR